jgi:MFS family permease
MKLDRKIEKGTLLIVIIGFVSLFGDFTYEGARSIIPQYFATLGGSALLLGIVLGVSEFAGYAIRLVSGRFADKHRNYWQIMFVGYAINLFAVPLLALAGNYIIAAILIFLERFGRGIRVPPRDYVISNAASKGKVGRAFAIEEGLDQTGAIIGPLSMALILFYRMTYQTAFSFLLIPAIIAIIVLFLAYRYYGKEKLARKKNVPMKPMSSGRFMLYSIAIAVSAAGVYQAAFVLYGANDSGITAYVIPLIFLVAMAGEGFFGFIFGLLYDRIGRNLVYAGLALSIFIPIFLAGGGLLLFAAAALFYGAVIGVQDTVMRAVVGTMISPEKRGSAFGIFNAFYGFGFLVSGIAVGYLFYSIGSIIEYVIVMQVIAFILLVLSFRKTGNRSG